MPSVVISFVGHQKHVEKFKRKTKVNVFFFFTPAKVAGPKREPRKYTESSSFKWEGRLHTWEESPHRWKKSLYKQKEVTYLGFEPWASR